MKHFLLWLGVPTFTAARAVFSLNDGFIITNIEDDMKNDPTITGLTANTQYVTDTSLNTGV